MISPHRKKVRKHQGEGGGEGEREGGHHVTIRNASKQVMRAQKFSLTPKLQ